MNQQPTAGREFAPIEFEGLQGQQMQRNGIGAEGVEHQQAECTIGLARQGANMSILMPYVDRLADFGLWYRQLWAESIGKNGKVVWIQATYKIGRASCRERV